MYYSNAVVFYGIKIDEQAVLKVKENPIYKKEIYEESSEQDYEDYGEFFCPIYWETLNKFNKNECKIEFAKEKQKI